MKAYHLINIVSFDETYQKYETDQQLSIEDAEPKSELTKTTDSYYKSFVKYELFHEAKFNRRGRAYGRDDTFDDFIGQKTFDCYLWRDENLLLFQANKQAVNGAIRRLTKKYGKDTFHLERRPVNFVRILERASNITGGWFGEIEGNVSSVGIFGDHVNLSSDYSRYAAAGELRSLTIEVHLGGSMYSFMITKDRVVVLYETMSVEKELDLLGQIYKELL